MARRRAKRRDRVEYMNERDGMLRPRERWEAYFTSDAYAARFCGTSLTSTANPVRRLWAGLSAGCVIPANGVKCSPWGVESIHRIYQIKSPGELCLFGTPHRWQVHAPSASSICIIPRAHMAIDRSVTRWVNDVVTVCTVGEHVRRNSVQCWGMPHTTWRTT